VCEGLDRAWQFFAMPASIIPDNTKAMIRRPDALDARLVDAFLDYVQARGLFVDARSPKDKPRVENQVPYVRESWFDGETFTSLDDARASAERWSREVAGARVHGTTRQVPAELFEAVEKPTMKPAPDAPFDVPRLDRPNDHHTPTTRYLRHVRVRADRSTVKIYFGTELIKVHPRKPPGGRSTDVHDYPAEKAAYALRDVDAILRKARDKGPRRSLRGAAPRWTAAVDEDAPGLRPARPLRQVHARRVEAICQSALAFDLVSVPRIARKLKAAAKPVMPCAAMGKVVQLPLPRFARPTQHFETRGTSSQKEGV
jgi:hypothetical protein